jgi:hypothetical protein
LEALVTVRDFIAIMTFFQQTTNAEARLIDQRKLEINNVKENIHKLNGTNILSIMNTEEWTKSKLAAAVIHTHRLRPP